MTKIENQTQYEWAVKRVEDLLPLVKDDTPLNNPNSIELELLSNLVADYSEEHFSLGEPSLVDVLKLRMYEMGLNQKSLSQLIGVSPSRLSDYISGKCEPTLKVAREISKKLNTKQQFEHVIALCRDLFSKKLHDYGPAWRILRPASVTDQIFIKANRIRSIETKGVTLIDEGIRAEFIAIVNYGIIGLIQLELGYAESADISNEEAMALYDKYAKEALELMLAKNHDYDEAWRSMRVSSYTDLILMKIYRTKQIESLAGNTLVSEGIDANYMDMINYSVFGLIKIEFEG